MRLRFNLLVEPRGASFVAVVRFYAGGTMTRSMSKPIRATRAEAEADALEAMGALAAKGIFPVSTGST